VDRLQYLPKNIQIDFELSALQQEAFEKIRIFLEKQFAFCTELHPVVRTQVYIKLIEQYILQGKQVLYMLPEIALTSQIIRRLQKHFGGYIGIYHSKFNQNERVEIWNKVKSGELRIVLGARSSVFLPYNRLGLIICDEEYDTSFKQQDPAPRYNGRDAAIYFASLFEAHVLLGSATPSLESYYNATKGKYGLVELMQRYGDVQLPPIEIIDTKKIIQKDRSKVMLSPQLVEEINKTVARDKQVILFKTGVVILLTRFARSADGSRSVGIAMCH
jgi:primosomal protein N' (replication factor Y)